MEQETINFISVLESEMKKQGHTYFSLGKAVGAEHTTLSRMLQLKTKPNLDLVIKIMKVLKIKKISI